MRKITYFLFLFLSFTSFAQAPDIAWQQNYGGSNEESPKSIIQTSDGGYIMIGSSNSNDNGIANHLNEGNTNLDYWVVKTAASGTIEWQRTYGGSREDKGASIAETLGGYIIAGQTYSNDGDVVGGDPNHLASYIWTLKIDGLGNILWQRCDLIGEVGCSVTSITKTTDNGFVIAGTCYAVVAYGDSFVMKIDALGDLVWQKIFAGNYHDDILCVKETADLGFIIAGGSLSTEGLFNENHGPWSTADGWLIKLNQDGLTMWQHLYGGSNDEKFTSVTEAGDGGFVAAGFTHSIDGNVSGNHSVGGRSDFWMVKVSNVGEVVWQKCFGGSDYDEANSIIKTADGGYLIAGYTLSSGPAGTADGNVTFNHNADSRDYWIVKTNANGALLWQKSLGGSFPDTAFSAIQDNNGNYVITGESQSSNGDISNNLGYFDFWTVKLSNETLTATAFESSSIVIYPNPANKHLNIRTNESLDISSIDIFNSLGQLILAIPNAQKVSTIDVSAMKSGTYFLKINSDEGTSVKKKFIKL